MVRAFKHTWNLILRANCSTIQACSLQCTDVYVVRMSERTEEHIETYTRISCTYTGANVVSWCMQIARFDFADKPAPEDMQVACVWVPNSNTIVSLSLRGDLYYCDVTKPGKPSLNIKVMCPPALFRDQDIVPCAPSLTVKILCLTRLL